MFICPQTINPCKDDDCQGEGEAIFWGCIIQVNLLHNSNGPYNGPLQDHPTAGPTEERPPHNALRQDQPHSSIPLEVTSTHPPRSRLTLGYPCTRQPPAGRASQPTALPLGAGARTGRAHLNKRPPGTGQVNQDLRSRAGSQRI